MIISPLIPDRRDAAAANTAALSRAFCSPVPVTVNIPTGHRYFVSGAFKTKPVVGCGRFTSDAAGGYPIKPTPQWDGSLARIEQIGTGPIGVLSGAGFICDDPIEFVGDGVSPIFQVEGRRYPATGRHYFRHLRFMNCGEPFDLLPGYTDDNGKWVDDENHADNSKVDWCEFMDCVSAIRSRNIQAVNWIFEDCMFGTLTPRPFTLAEIARGGLMSFIRPRFCTWQLTWLRIVDPQGVNYSPNTARFSVENAEFDRVISDQTYLCPVEYVGDSYAVPYSKWHIRGNVWVNQPLTLDYRVPANLPRDLWDICKESIYTK